MRKVIVSLVAAVALVGLAGCGGDDKKPASGPGGIALVNADTLTSARISRRRGSGTATTRRP
jgi:hypothetical protein